MFNYTCILRHMSNCPNITLYLTAITSWLARSNIGKSPEKRQTIARGLFWPVFDNNIGIDFLCKLSSTLATVPFVIQEGDLFNQLSIYADENQLLSSSDCNLTSFWKAIAGMTPTGLNTSPNACCGKYELLYRLLRPHTTQPNKGDVLDEGLIIELKGEGVRLSDPTLTGLSYIRTTNALFSRTKFEGNISSAAKWRGELVFEIEKKHKKKHYITQFAQDAPLARQLISEYLKIHSFCLESQADKFASDIIPSILDSQTGDTIYGEYNQDKLHEVMIRSFYEKYKSKQKFDRIIIFGDGSDVKFIDNVKNLAKLKLAEDFFRISQTHNVGWYVY
jgi:hypothetical protein